MIIEADSTSPAAAPPEWREGAVSWLETEIKRLDHQWCSASIKGCPLTEIMETQLRVAAFALVRAELKAVKRGGA